MVTTILEIILQALKGFCLLLPNMLKLVDAIVEYFVEKNRRAREAVIAEQVALKRAADNQAKKEQANIQAFHTLVDEGWKLTYKQLFDLISCNLYDKVLVVTKLLNDPEVDSILFSDKTAEYRAFLIVEKMRAASN